MADLPITFSGPMVRALLREIEKPGTGKTQTRRVIKPQPTVNSAGLLVWKTRNLSSQTSPEGLAMWMRIKVGDRLYVREHWRVEAQLDPIAPRDMQPQSVAYVADETPGYILRTGRFRQAMHMPKWASRITLIVTDVRVERLQDCSEADALAEGVVYDERKGFIVPGVDHPNPDFPYLSRTTAREMYAALWDVINGPGAWAENPWAVAYSFKPILGHIDQIGKAEHA